MKVSARCLNREFDLYRGEYLEKAGEILASGIYVNGKEGAAFERAFAARLGRRHCVSLGNGTDALFIALKCLGIGPGAEVIVPCNTFVADFLAVKNAGAVPVPADADAYYCLDPARIEARITPRTKALIAVHLYGHAADLDALSAIAERYGLVLIEDCAQAFGTLYKGKPAGAFGAVSCFSFYPTKNLGAFGDAGCVVTDSDALCEKIRAFKNYGTAAGAYVSEGVNSRMDELQAGLLNVKLAHADDLLRERRRIAGRYLAEIANAAVALPLTAPYSTHTYHQFVVRCSARDALKRHLAAAGVETQIHYEAPPYLAEVYACGAGAPDLTEFSAALHKNVLSLPIYAGLTDEEISCVVGAVNAFAPGGEGDSR